MGRHEELTERDIGVLQDLNKTDVLKMKHIREKHYPDAPEYCYKRIRKLIQRGYIRKIGYLYMITDKGVRALGEKITTPSRKKVNKMNQHRKALLSELYCKLQPYGWTWHNSRETKAKYNLNRISQISGELEHSGRQYLLYVLSQRPHQSTIGQIIAELQNLFRHIDKKHAIILSESRTGIEHFTGQMTTYGMTELHLLPVGLALNTILPAISDPNWLTALVTHLIPEIQQIKPANALHADLNITVDGKEYHLTEMLTYDIVKRYHLLHYGSDQAALGKNTLLITLNTFDAVENFQETFAAYPHIKIIKIDREWLHTTLINPLIAEHPTRKEYEQCTYAPAPENR